MKNKCVFSIITILVIVLASCGMNESSYSHQKMVEMRMVDSIVISKRPEDNNTKINEIWTTKKLSNNQSEIFIQRWNRASSIGLCKYFCRYKISIYLKDKSKRVFSINENAIKESNDWCFDLKDKEYIQELWNSTK